MYVLTAGSLITGYLVYGWHEGGELSIQRQISVRIFGLWKFTSTVRYKALSVSSILYGETFPVIGVGVGLTGGEWKRLRKLEAKMTKAKRRLNMRAGCIIYLL